MTTDAQPTPAQPTTTYPSSPAGWGAAPTPTSTATLNPSPTLFARSRIYTLEQGTPGEKVTGSLDWSLGEQLRLSANYSYLNASEPADVGCDDLQRPTSGHRVAGGPAAFGALVLRRGLRRGRDGALGGARHVVIVEQAHAGSPWAASLV